MSWARLDDSFWRNPKITELLDTAKGPEALALHVAAISYCAEHLTDGVVDKSDIRRIVRWHNSRVKSALQSLLQSGLWDIVEPGVKWRVHDFLDYNPTRQEVLVKREKDARRQRKHRGLSQRDNVRDITNASRRD